MSNNTINGGIGLSSALTLMFVFLKLWGKIDWSWWWVLSPLWLGLALFIAAVLLVLIVAALIVIIKDRKRLWEKFKRQLNIYWNRFKNE